MKRIIHIHARTWNKGDYGLVLAMQQLLRKELGRIEFIDYDIKKLKAEGFGRVARRASDCDAIIIGGGGLYGKWLFPIDINPLKGIETPIILFSVGYDRTQYNPDLTAREWKSVRELNEIASLSSARDELSLKKLRAVGVKNAALVPDPAIFLKPEKKKLPLKKENVNIGLNIAYHWWMRTSEPSKSVKLPLRERLLDSVSETCSGLKECFGAEIFYMPHFYTEKSVLRRLQKRFEVKELNLQPGEMVHAYSRFNLGITMNMHSAIFSFNAGTPFANIMYNVKNRAFCELAGMGKYCLEIGGLGGMLPACLELLEREGELRKKLKEKKKNLWKKEQAFLRKVGKIIK